MFTIWSEQLNAFGFDIFIYLHVIISCIQSIIIDIACWKVVFLVNHALMNVIPAHTHRVLQLL